MQLVIKSLVSGSIKEIEINSLADIMRLAGKYPVINEMRRKTSNPLQLLQYLVQYLSKNHLSAWLEGDDLPKPEQLVKAEKLVKAIKDKPNLGAKDPNQGIVSQVQPQTGKFSTEGAQPYKKRFPETMLLSVKNAKDIKTEPVSEGLWHHYGPIDENHTIHVLSSSPEKYHMSTIRPLAGIITGKSNGKNFIRAAFSETTHDRHLDALKSKVMLNKKNKFEEPIAVDSAKHMEPGWEAHNPDLVHGIVPDHSLQAPPNTFSKWISFAGVKGDETPRVVAKESIDQWTKHNDQNKSGSRVTSYFDHPTFTTAHREAAYSKLADEVFHLGEYVPKVALFKHPISGKTWSAMQFVPGLKPITAESVEHDTKHLEENGDLYKMAIMNMILGNNDRHFNNFMKDASGRVHLIDHGLTFDYNHITTGLVPVYADSPSSAHSLMDKKVPESVHQWLWSLDSVALANKLHKMGAPHDIIMTAVHRLGDARSWSNAVKYGSRLYDKDLDQSFKFLAKTIRSRQFSVTIEQHNKIIEEMRRNMLIGKGDKTVTKNVPNTIDKDGGSTTALLSDEPATVTVNPSGQAKVNHPSNEVTLRHPEDKEGESSKRRNR